MNPRKLAAEIAEIKKILLSQTESGALVEEIASLKKEVEKLSKEVGKKDTEIKKLKKIKEDK